MNAQRFRFVLAGLIVLILAAIGATGYYGITVLHNLASESDKVKIEAQVNDDASIDATKAEQQFHDPRVERLTKYLDELVPPKTYRDQFVADINKYAADSGVAITSLVYSGGNGAKPSAKTPVIEGANAIPIEISLGNDIAYDDFIDFVKALEGNLQHIQVLSLDLSPSADDRSKLANASLTVALYVEK